ncbi:hypothetical protein C4K35_0061 [Pseudomonas chlororaphis subsp. piscium]|nr:hypothetical protein C4K35_0061 [Pseudomonas chlororaphis subsp. piscium]AZC54263.1 hypothetical protein C4K34_0060 [Pseudomonas chlororaphis subsp. piscium]AZC60590.1 hypothetical protein C4K33_0060 [Pseudomonas chlororaphis subsp. piscium]AZC66760.1 hypothetical protein C4K32_0060 [Pseudomonas chlororaphis subsp. piscium]
MTYISRSRRHIHGPGAMRLAEYRPQQEAHPDLWMSHHCGFPLSFLLSRRLSPAAKGSAAQTTNLNRRAFAAHAVGRHQLTSYRPEYRQRLRPRNAVL